MPYLTFAEYTDYGFTELEETEFDKLLPKASDVIDSVTRDFYQFNNIDEDVEFRATQFKKAVACQVGYFNDVGATTSHDLSTPNTVTIGRTTVSKGGKGSNENSSGQNSIISTDAYMYLRGTGLLYRGIGVSS